jgi:hypothetical protein
MTLADQREPVPRRGGARRFRPPTPTSFELPRPDAAGPRPPLQPARPDVEGAPYVQQLESQLRTLSRTVGSLQQQLSGYARRNQELEADHMRLASYRAESERGVAERAAETIRDAEARAAQITAAAEARAGKLEQEARVQVMSLIESVGAEIDALEQDAARLRQERDETDLPGAAPAGGLGDAGVSEEPAPGARRPTLALAGTPEAAAAEDAEARAAADEAALKRIRGEIADLLRLREAILVSIRGAIDGFNQQLSELERPPLAVAGEDTAPTAAGASTPPAGAAGALLIEVEVSPVSDVLAASRIEQQLAAIGGDVHLRSVEGRTAKLQVRGLAPEQLGPALASGFDGSTAEWDGDGVVRLALAAPTSTKPEKKSS